MPVIKYDDVSHHNVNYKPKWHTALKVTQGTGYVDPEWRQTAQRTEAGGWDWIGYHYLEHVSISAQVTNLIKQIGTGRSCMLDVERVDLSGVHHPELDPTLQDVFDFTDEYASRSSGIVSLDYIPEWYWRDYWGHPKLTGIAARGSALISSYYGVPLTTTGPGWDEYATTQHGVTFKAGIKPDIWQYTASPVDTNAFKGTEAQLLALWHGGSAHPSVPVEVDVQLTDPITLNGGDKSTVGAVLVSLENRTRNLGPWEKQELDQILATLAGLPAAVIKGLPTEGVGSFSPEQIAQVQAAMSTALANVKVTVTTN